MTDFVNIFHKTCQNAPTCLRRILPKALTCPRRILWTIRAGIAPSGKYGSRKNGMDISTPLLELLLCCCRLGAGLVGSSKPVRTYFGSKKENISNYGHPLSGCSAFFMIQPVWTCQQCQRRKLSFCSAETELHPIHSCSFQAVGLEFS